ncbi:hypothetical protein CCM_08033 [Cordyceps militaris CM01]|uniref:T6SS Phospholipase effector Tle1-like catalytic domain-containing protein n=1 Tax=Cordyceps militaris (strain CM01) TaxID=983644 RepID=G3JPH0_CORMM|nr:uncharacterized protein CCM_08033 [Cordyceps militaris CM01]EGX89780.1 hypothetical protein CCM_08033 [Cordyceps militaris CM01]
MNPPVQAPAPGQRKLVLCFDGTGNKFHGDDSDSNILKIFRMLDRSSENQYHYYQPGIGTYVTSEALSQSGIVSKISEHYQKAKDSAIGSSFDQHVVSGYRFLMRYYKNGDQIYMFGFSRGAYIARFLAEMLDYIGLLSHGNEEMIKFAWRAFSQWQCRRKSRGDENPDDEESEAGEGEDKVDKMYTFMKDFRETFSRPVGRIRFLGLFDTVNSVSRFESAWMQRAKFPYTARTSAEVIRHAVSIDERRAKFRQDLLYQKTHDHKRPHHHHFSELLEPVRRSFEAYLGGDGPGDAGDAADSPHSVANAQSLEPPSERTGRNLLSPENGTRREPRRSKSRNHVPYRMAPRAHSFKSKHRNGHEHVCPGKGPQKPEFEEDVGQDIDEVWFAGGHGDIGGGWPVPDDRRSASHVPLTWIVREAMNAGLEFDMHRATTMGCTEAPVLVTVQPPPEAAGVPEPTQSSFQSQYSSVFTESLHMSHTSSLHDSLVYGGGLGHVAVTAWKMMEWLPFRRMDLQRDGSWRPIRWPLPRGEVRDVPDGVRVHGSVLRRMQTDEGYRPGNLIVGGGGRGKRRAPKEYGMGEWQCVAEPGDPIGEIWMRK